MTSDISQQYFYSRSNQSFKITSTGIILYSHYESGTKHPIQFIRIATIIQQNKLQIVWLTRKQRLKLEESIAELENALFNEEISQKHYNTRIDKVMDTIFAKTLSYRHMSKKEFIKKWESDRFRNKLIENFKNLLQLNIEIIPITFKYDRRLVLLIDKGPIYNYEITEKEIMNRNSPLDHYPDVGKLNQLITYDLNYGIRILPELPSNHKQSSEIPNRIYKILLGKYSEPENYINPKILKKFFHLSRELTANYIFSLPLVNQETYVINPTNYTKFVYCSMKPNSLLMLNSSHYNFRKFMRNYSDSTIIVNSSKQSEDVSNNSDYEETKITSQRILHFGRMKIEGYTDRNLENLRLDLIDFSTKNGIIDFAFIFKQIDLVLGEKYFSSQNAWSKAIQDLLEYFDKDLGHIQIFDDLMILIEKQMDMTSVIGNHRNISLIYQLLRQYTLSYILDAFVREPRASNIYDTNYFVNFDTSDCQTHNSVLSIIFLVYKICQNNRSNDRITVVISDFDVVKRLMTNEIIRVLNSVLAQNRSAGVRLILYSSDKRFQPKSTEVPLLSIEELDKDQSTFKNMIRIGTDVEVKVKL